MSVKIYVNGTAVNSPDKDCTTIVFENQSHLDKFIKLLLDIPPKETDTPRKFSMFPSTMHEDEAHEHTKNSIW